MSKATEVGEARDSVRIEGRHVCLSFGMMHGQSTVTLRYWRRRLNVLVHYRRDVVEDPEYSAEPGSDRPHYGYLTGDHATCVKPVSTQSANCHVLRLQVDQVLRHDGKQTRYPGEKAVSECRKTHAQAESTRTEASDPHIRRRIDLVQEALDRRFSS